MPQYTPEEAELRATQLARDLERRMEVDGHDVRIPQHFIDTLAQELLLASNLASDEKSWGSSTSPEAPGVVWDDLADLLALGPDHQFAAEIVEPAAEPQDTGRVAAGTAAESTQRFASARKIAHDNGITHAEFGSAFLNEFRGHYGGWQFSHEAREYGGTISVANTGGESRSVSIGVDLRDPDVLVAAVAAAIRTWIERDVTAQALRPHDGTRDLPAAGIEAVPGRCGGRAVVIDTRVGIEHVMFRAAYGRSINEIANDLAITPAQVRQALLFGARVYEKAAFRRASKRRRQPPRS